MRKGTVAERFEIPHAGNIAARYIKAILVEGRGDSRFDREWFFGSRCCWKGRKIGCFGGGHFRLGHL